jgi:3-hydroxyisobutyrate dehydrogenase
MTSYAPLPGVGPASPADNGYQGGFATGLMLKDLKLAAQAARDAGANTPMGARATELYQRFADEGHAGMDFSGIIKMLTGETADV